MRPTVPSPSMSTPSYSCWAMAMVRRGVMESLRDASCCMVEVVKGGEGLRCLSVRFTVLTVKGACSVSWTTASTSSADFSSAFLPSFPW